MTGSSRDKVVRREALARNSADGLRLAEAAPPGTSTMASATENAVKPVASLREGALPAGS